MPIPDHFLWIGITVVFCERTAAVLRLTLLFAGNNQESTLIDLLKRLPLENQQLLIKTNEKPTNATGVFNF